MLTYGFYDSKNHDRRYNAIQMSSIFDGIIKDGIFMSIGERFEVTANGDDMFVTVGTGRAWFDHTWTLNDAPLLIELPESELLLNRYDAIVLEINSDQDVRENSIKVIKGTPSSNPVYPTLTNTKLIHQYPLAYVYVEKEATSVRVANITSMIGKDPAPYVTGILETINIESMVAQWEDQWKAFFEAETEDMTSTNEEWKAKWEEFYNTYVSEMDDTSDYWKDLWHSWYHMYTDSSSEEFGNWKNDQKASFEEWFNSLKDMLDSNAEAKIAADIEELDSRTTELEEFKSNLSNYQSIYGFLEDSDKDVITDSEGDPIEGAIIFRVKGDDEESVNIERFIENIEKFIIDFNNWHDDVSTKEDVVDNLDSESEDCPLSAKQGKILKEIHSKVITIVIPASGWSSTAPFENIVSVEEVHSDDNVDVTFRPTEGVTNNQNKQAYESYSYINYCDTGDGTITFYAMEDKPTSNVTVAIKGIIGGRE